MLNTRSKGKDVYGVISTILSDNQHYPTRLHGLSLIENLIGLGS